MAGNIEKSDAECAVHAHNVSQMFPRFLYCTDNQHPLAAAQAAVED